LKISLLVQSALVASWFASKEGYIISISTQLMHEQYANSDLPGAPFTNMKPTKEEARKLATFLETGQTLAGTYGLKAVLVLDGPDLPTSSLTAPLGNLAAQLLDETLADGQVLGIAWGRTLAATAKALTHLPKVDVVQAAGSPAGLDFSQNPVELVHRLASLSGGEAYPVYAPMWAEDPQLIQRLRQEPSVARAIGRYDDIDVLVVGIGSWNPAESGLCSGFPAPWRDEALAAGVQADVCATLIDREGREVPSRLDENGLGITTAQLCRIPEIIGIGGGLEKAEAIAAVLRGGWINVLVTDAGVARRLLQ